MTRPNTRATKRTHDRRRALGVCINGEAHGPAVKGGRCLPCYDKKLAIDRARYPIVKAQRAAARAAKKASAA